MQEGQNRGRSHSPGRDAAVFGIACNVAERICDVEDDAQTNEDDLPVGLAHEFPANGRANGFKAMLFVAPDFLQGFAETGEFLVRERFGFDNVFFIGYGLDDRIVYPGFVEFFLDGCGGCRVFELDVRKRAPAEIDSRLQAPGKKQNQSAGSKEPRKDKPEFIMFYDTEHLSAD